MSHWCKDIPRDIAVRAAEDCRTGPLPTLEEAVATITHKGNDMPTKSEIQAAEYRDEASERTEIELPPTPEPSVARVTLEFSGRLRAPPSSWPWDLILSGECIVRSEPGESVRVVEESAEALAVAWGISLDAYRGRIARLTDERDTAIREREELRDSYRHCRAGNNLVCDERDALKNRVADLESQLESVADRAAAAETALESAPAASDAVTSEIRDGVLALEHMLYVFRDDQRPTVQIRLEKLRRLVEVLRESAPAASDAAGTEVVGSSVWRELRDAAVCLPHCGGERLQKAIAVAERMLTQPRSAASAASGWLTAEERKFLERIRNYNAKSSMGSASAAHEAHSKRIYELVGGLLDSSSPPEVVLPLYPGIPHHTPVSQGVWNDCIRRVKKVLDAAGVPVKEVGRE